jgi:hypothetical protein
MHDIFSIRVNFAVIKMIATELPICVQMPKIMTSPENANMAAAIMEGHKGSFSDVANDPAKKHLSIHVTAKSPSDVRGQGLYSSSESYQAVTWIRKDLTSTDYFFNSAQGVAIRVLHEAHLKGGGGRLNDAEIMEIVENEVPPRRRRSDESEDARKGLANVRKGGLQALFRPGGKTHPAWGYLIKGGEAVDGRNLRGQYYLDL